MVILEFFLTFDVSCLYLLLTVEAAILVAWVACFLPGWINKATALHIVAVWCVVPVVCMYGAGGVCVRARICVHVLAEFGFSDAIPPAPASTNGRRSYGVQVQAVL